ncbi:MAG TPA: hypothetical protein VGV86_04210 [Acidimicrobiales bacterium]|nr:hypothetical protein [Acidimicrobiales bacterium]
MAKSASMQMRIEYLKGRRALRLTAHGADAPLGSVEVPFAALVVQLQIDPGELAPPSRLLLFAGLHDRPHGGAADLIGCFESEVEGRAAFRRLREERSDDEGWAQLVSLGDNGRRTLLAWFGRNGNTKEMELKPRQLRLVVNRHHSAAHPARSHLRLPST